MSDIERETLKAVFRLTSNADGAARTGSLAQALGISQGTATVRVQRLAERSLVRYERYRGVVLTPKGRREAVTALRRHRIVERFLSDMLEFPWAEADRLAVNFENRLPERVVTRLFEVLGRPATCPHGYPIPAAESDDVVRLPPLGSLAPGDEGVVAIPAATDEKVVAFLATMGLTPGTRVAMREKQPFDGPVVVRVDGKDRTIGNKLAHQIHVHRDPARTD